MVDTIKPGDTNKPGAEDFSLEDALKLRELGRLGRLPGHAAENPAHPEPEKPGAQTSPPPKTETDIVNNAIPTEEKAQTDTQGEKSNLTPAQLKRRKETEDILAALLDENVTFEEACQQAGVSRRTGYRLFEKWANNEAKIVDAEFWSLFFKMRKERPAKALECLTRVKVRMMPFVFKGETSIKANLIVKGALWNPADEKPVGSDEQQTDKPGT